MTKMSVDVKIFDLNDLTQKMKLKDENEGGKLKDKEILWFSNTMPESKVKTMMDLNSGSQPFVDLSFLEHYTGKNSTV